MSLGASIQMKADVVMEDERESGVRMKLNFGHTLGHAIEAATHYKALLHGEAVAWGSVAALHLGLRRGAIDPEQFEYLTRAIYAFGPLPAFEADPEVLVKLTAGDKKARSGAAGVHFADRDWVRGGGVRRDPMKSYCGARKRCWRICGRGRDVSGRSDSDGSEAGWAGLM